MTRVLSFTLNIDDPISNGHRRRITAVRSLYVVPAPINYIVIDGHYLQQVCVMYYVIRLFVMALSAVLCRVYGRNTAVLASVWKL